MPTYDPNPQIIAMSLEELNFILNWIREEQGESYDNPITVLIGGWAVDAYNPWYGSVDIDLVTNSRTKNRLKRILIRRRGYESFRIPSSIINTVSKPTGDGDFREIIIDFISRKRIKFEGQEAYLDFNVPNEQTIVRELSEDIEKEKAKFIKDDADILALIDPNHGGTELDLNFLGEKLDEPVPNLINNLK